MTVTEFVRARLMRENQAYADTAADHYNHWEQHIKLVVREALLLADAYGADREIVELGALLHDIALVTSTGTRAEHHVNGAEIADRWLDEYGYPAERRQRVVGCVLHHRSSKYAENLEELCVADADILAHYDNIPMCFGAAYRYGKIKTGTTAEWIAYFTRDYHDLSEQTKVIFGPRFERIMEVLFGAMTE